MFSYTYINNLFKNHIENINNELNKNIIDSYNLLENTDLANQFVDDNKVNTNIYTKNINNNIRIDTMIENKYNYNDILNIKYLSSNVNVFNIYQYILHK